MDDAADGPFLAYVHIATDYKAHRATHGGDA